MLHQEGVILAYFLQVVSILSAKGLSRRLPHLNARVVIPHPGPLPKGEGTPSPLTLWERGRG